MKRLLAPFLSLAALNAGAALYVCEGPNGQIMRSEPCEKGESHQRTYHTKDVRYYKDPRAYDQTAPRQPGRLESDRVAREAKEKADAEAIRRGYAGAAKALEKANEKDATKRAVKDAIREYDSGSRY